MKNINWLSTQNYMDISSILGMLSGGGGFDISALLGGLGGLGGGLGGGMPDLGSMMGSMGGGMPDLGGMMGGMGGGMGGGLIGKGSDSLGGSDTGSDLADDAISDTPSLEDSSPGC